jgi:hypothetical protein
MTAPTIPSDGQSTAFAELDGEAPELIPPGIYDLKFLYHETKRVFDRPKVFLWFAVMSFGDHFEKRIPRYYGATKLIGQKGKHGRFKIGHKSDFRREFCTLFSANVRRLDRMPMSEFQNVLLVGRVRTVSRGYNQRPIPPHAQYSVIDELLGLKAL